MEEEKFEEGVGLRDYLNLFSFSFGCWAILIYLVISILCSLLQLAPSYILVVWSSKSLQEQLDDPTWMYAFIICVALFMAFNLLRAITMQLFMIQATTNMHNTMTEKVIRAKILFFDSNPSGRVISRFAKDIGVLDNVMPVTFVFVTIGALRSISIIITIAVVNPFLIIPGVLGFLYMIWVCKTGLKSMLEAQRLDFLQQGPIN